MSFDDSLPTRRIVATADGRSRCLRRAPSNIDDSDSVLLWAQDDDGIAAGRDAGPRPCGTLGYYVYIVKKQRIAGGDDHPEGSPFRAGVESSSSGEHRRQGHLYEFLTSPRWPSPCGVLQEKGKGATWMLQDGYEAIGTGRSSSKQQRS